MPAKPKFEKFEVMRANSDGTLNDEGVKPVFNIKTSFENDTHYLDFGLTIEFTEYDPYGSGTPVTTYMSVLPNDDELLTPMKSSSGLVGSLLHGTSFDFDTTKTYNVKARLTDGQEYAYAFSTIPFAFANVHLGGSSQGGVAFGKYLQNVGWFECNFNSRFYGSAIVDGDSYFNKTMTLADKVWVKNGVNGSTVITVDPSASGGANMLSVSGPIGSGSTLSGYKLSVGNGGASVGSGGISTSGGISASSLSATTITGGLTNVVSATTGGQYLASGAEGTYTLGFGRSIQGVVICLYGTENLSKVGYNIYTIGNTTCDVFVRNNGTVGHWFEVRGLAKCS